MLGVVPCTPLACVLEARASTAEQEMPLLLSSQVVAFIPKPPHQFCFAPPVWVRCFAFFISQGRNVSVAIQL